MSSLTEVKPISPETVERVLIGGDLSRLQPAEKMNYFMRVCDSLGLNPLTKPFEFIKLNGKEVLYAKRDATDQLRRVHKVSVKIVSREQIEGVWIVTAQASTPDGRADESVGAVPTQGLKGDSLANALMKAETKAKRRVTLSICGLGMLDETEVDTIKGDETAPIEPPKNPLKEVREAEALFEADPGEYVITFGQWGPKKDGTPGQKIKDVDVYELDNYVEYIEAEIKKNGKEPRHDVMAFLKAALAYLDSRTVGEKK